MKNIGSILLIIVAVGIGIAWDIIRWHAFQEFNHSDMGFWKWQFLFNSRR